MLGVGSGCGVEITGAVFFAAGAFFFSGGTGGVGACTGGAGTGMGGAGSGSIRRAMICGGMLAARRAVSTRSGNASNRSACSASDAASA